MKREDQVMLIMQIIQKQRRKNPTASELELLANTKTVCKLLVASEDLEKEVVDESLAIVFETERALLEKRRKEEKEAAAKAAAMRAKAKAEAAEKERERLKKAAAAYRPAPYTPDPCSSSYGSSRGGSC